MFSMTATSLDSVRGTKAPVAPVQSTEVPIAPVQSAEAPFQSAEELIILVQGVRSKGRGAW
jgi:hypothetical protein